MKWRISIMTLGLAAVMFSCKNKSEGDDATTDTLSNTTTTTNEAMTTVVNVPAGVKTSFEGKYPQASNVRWEYYQPGNPAYIDWEWTGWPAMDNTDYVASYTWDGTDYMSWYDDQGNWIGTVNVISDYNSLPAPVNNAIKKQYSGYTINSVKRENDKDRTAYEIELSNNSGSKGKLLIDEKGNIMKKKIDNANDTDTKEKMNPKDSAQ